MKRRELLRCAAAAALGGGFASRTYARNAGNINEFDRFGGWTKKKFEATGFFRVEKDKRWWLVTPEGNAFLSFGINHLFPDLFKQQYNREAWKKRLGLDDLNSPQFAAALKS